MNTHETDFYSWTQEQAALLKQGRYMEADYEHLIEELESMGRSEKRELENRLAVLLAHLLKWQYQQQKRTSSWEVTVETQRQDVQDVLLDNPGLKSTIGETMVRAYRKARAMATRETQLKPTVFPSVCPWPLEQALGSDFWPD